MFEFFKNLSLPLKQAMIKKWWVVLSVFFLFIKYYGIWLMIGTYLFVTGGCSLYLAIKRRSFRKNLLGRHAIWCQFQDPEDNITLLCSSNELKEDTLILSDCSYTKYDLLIKMHEIPFTLQDIVEEVLFSDDLEISFTIRTLSLYVEADPTNPNLLHCLGLVPRLKFPKGNSSSGEDHHV